MKHNEFLYSLFILCFIFACQDSDNKKEEKPKKINGKMITDTVLQDTLFKNLKKLTKNSIPDNRISDSLVFLLLPVQASCPNCLKKTIDSIVKYKDQLDEWHFIVITGNGIRTIAGYFEREKKQIPFESGIFYDTLEVASNTNMSSNNPNVYYAAGEKVYRKVSCLPSTIKGDLHEFFSGLKDENNLGKR